MQKRSFASVVALVRAPINAYFLPCAPFPREVLYIMLTCIVLGDTFEAGADCRDRSRPRLSACSNAFPRSAGCGRQIASCPYPSSAWFARRGRLVERLSPSITDGL